MNFLIGLLTVVLVLTSLFLVLIVLMQRAKSDGGMGAAMGGSATESAFGADTNNVLSGATIKAAIIFFVVSFALYLMNIRLAKHHDDVDSKLPTIVAPAASAPKPAAAPLTAPSSQPATPAPGEPKKP